jgi:cytochrome b subunit of formate dehydrogenase
MKNIKIIIDVRMTILLVLLCLTGFLTFCLKYVYKPLTDGQILAEEQLSTDEESATTLQKTITTANELHNILGLIFVPIVITHIILNGRWLLGAIKNLFMGKLNAKAKYMLMLAVGLVISFSLCLYSGIYMYILSYTDLPWIYESMQEQAIDPLYALHGYSSIACFVLTVLHIQIHWGYIKSFFKVKKREEV